MAEIVFVNPPLTLEERYGHMAPGGSLMPPIGLCNLAAVTRAKGYTTKILDSVALCLGFDETIASLAEFSPQYVGLTSATVSIHNAAEVARLVKEKNSSIITIIGGPHVTAVPVETMQRFAHFDVAVVGEGEDAIVELLKGLENGRDLKEIPGLVVKGKDGVVVTEPRPFIEDLDSLPMPAWDLLPPIAKYYRPSLLRGFRLPASGLITSRGCTGKCTFCDRSVFGNKLRAYSAEYVMAMMRELHFKYGMKELFIFDDNFLVFRRRLESICEMLKREKWDFQWSCFARVDFVKPDILELMKQAGCRLIAYGIESGSQEMLNFLHKGISLDKTLQVLQWTKEAGIMTEGLFMLGLPGETEETMQMTIDFAKRNEFDDIAITIFTPLPGTKLTKDIQQYGHFDNDWKKMSQHYPVFVPWALTREKIERYSDKGFREFYLRPKIMLSYLFRIKSLTHLFAFIKAAVRFIRAVI